MDTGLLNNPVERRKAVRLRTRPDLQITEQRYEGKVYHVVKDPVCLRYYRFNRQEFFVFNLFNGNHTMEEVKGKFEDEFKPHRLEYNDLEGFARQLITAGLVQSETVGTGKHLFERRAKQRRMKRLAALSSILYWKIPVFDPDRILTWMYGWLWWMFTVPFFVASCGLMLAAVFHVALHFQTFYDKLPAYHEFFSFNSVLYLWLSLGVVKVIHEFGHGLSCKAFGGECHEMGILLMCLSPALYCNVTDAWTISDKWKRIIISFAGIYVELIIAAISTFVWWYTPHMPVVNNIALCLMTLCSVSTFFFNANPLMRFDGYYIMADWLEIPNLRDRSNRYITNTFLDKGLGIEVPPEPYMAPSRKVLFISYAVLSWVYRWVVTFSIIWMLSDFLGPKLKVLSHMIAIMSLVSMFVWPAYRMVKNVRQRGRLPDMKAKRVYITLTLFVALVAGFFLLPLPISRVRDTGLVSVHPDHGVSVGLTEPARLHKKEVVEGQAVVEGQVLARFISQPLTEEMTRVEAEMREGLQIADNLRRQRESEKNLPPASVTQLLAQEVEYRQRAVAATQKLDELKRRADDLYQVRAPRNGVVMGLPSGTDLGKQYDRNFQDQKPVCTVGDPTKLIVKIPVSANDYRLLKEDQGLLKDDEAKKGLEVSFYVIGRTDRIFKGRLLRLPDSDAKQVPVALTQRGGGPLAVKQAGEGGQETVPLAQTYLVEAELTDPDGTVRPGALVQAKIHCRWRTGAWWVARFISSALDIGLY
jgi:putative peptide zinc metalloprotease protein